MNDLSLWMVLAPGLPLVAAVVVALLGRPVLRGRSHWPVVLALAGSLGASLLLLRDVSYHSGQTAGAAESVGFEHVVRLWTWANVTDAFGKADFAIDVTLRADPLTAVMLVMVTFVALLVALYSIGYMHHDPGYPRYFALIALFVFSMTMLVLVSNFVLLYVFWEAVGACSYLLIGYWFHKPEAAAAGKKAFLVNRVGDFGFALALFLIWTTFGTLNFHDPESVIDFRTGEKVVATNDVASDSPTAADAGPAGVLGQRLLAHPERYRPRDPATRMQVDKIQMAICLLLLLGACGKSAQFPLHVWLPDAMEGPTPVSALIHAATMVTAGVYMVTRCTPLFMLSPAAQAIVAMVGATTALLAGIIALTQTDLKRVLAYSTVSQLGYMFLALGTGTQAGIIAGMFHLFTHAFFKALLFLGAGSVMHAMGGVIDMRRFGGLRKLMPITSWTFLIGCLTLAGFPFLSGFWSKDQIIAAVHAAGEHGEYDFVFHILYYVALVTAFLTAFYTFRAFFMTFYGAERIPEEAGHHAHESPAMMTAPLVILAVFAIGIGGYLELTHGFTDFLRRTPSLASATHVPPGELNVIHWNIAALSGAIALAGIGLAAYMYLGERREAEWLATSRLTAPLYELSYAKLLFDEMYLAAVVWPVKLLAHLAYFVDRWVIDGAVNLVGRIPAAIGAMLRPLQNGLVQFYAGAMAVAVVVLIAVMLW